MTDSTQPEALRLADELEFVSGGWGVADQCCAELRRQHAENTTLQRGYDEALRERDDAEDFIDALLDEVLGHERPEWSSSYGRADALNDVQERMTALHKPAVDKAWGRFQSAMAAPKQEAQEPVAWQGVHDQTDLYYTKPLQADVRPLYAAPQPAPVAQEPIEVHEPKCPALIGDACTCDRHGPAADSQPVLPKITAEDRSLLHYNPNTDDIVEWVQRYASAAITADRAMLEQAAPRVGTIGHIGGGPITLTAAVAPLLAGKAAPAAVAGPVAYRVLRKRHDGEWVTDGRAWCDGVPTQDLVDDIALRSDGWRIEYAFAIPTTQAAPVAHGDALPSLFREALAWGMTYGPEIPAHQWEEMRESMVEKFTARAQAKEGQAMTDTTSAAPTYEQVIASWNAQADEYNQWGELGEDEKIEWALKCADQFRGATKMMQVAQQALEALEAAVSDDRPYFRKSKSAIAALREALEAAP
jgi:hypothetical protein